MQGFGKIRFRAGRRTEVHRQPCIIPPHACSFSRPPVMSDFSFCSQLARSHDVSPAGTATEAAHWLLIEDPSAWGESAVEEADWFPEVRAALLRWEAAVPDLRVQLIRRAFGTWDTPGRIRCFVVRAGPEPVVRDWSLEAYDDLSRLDVPGTLRASRDEEGSVPLVLTCVNGKRDACCAKWGRPVAQAAADAAPNAAWQTSHLGGHRFAPIVLLLPHGTQYGWLRPDDISDLVAAHQQGRLFDLDRIRGRVDQSRPVQAACLSLRSRLDLHDLNAVQGTVVEGGKGVWTVQVTAGGQTRTARVRQHERAVAFPHSCGDGKSKSDVEWTVTWEAPTVSG